MRKSIKIQRMLWLNVIFFSFLTVSSFGLAVCLNGKISLGQEFNRSDFIARATLVRERKIIEFSDPGGVAATRFDFFAKMLYKGKGRRFSVWIDNTSSRIEFERNVEYVLFVKGEGRRAYIDACGNSGPVKDSAVAVEWLMRKNSASP